MKKKPELFKKQGKSSLTLRNFLNNLKENDLHYENKQITQCVFLGVLRLKPVPSIFTSNNVPSVSASATSSTSQAVKDDTKNNTNKKLKKNISRDNDINKVLNGKVSKKNPQQVKAAVRKVPVKQSDIIKIKLNAKEKIVKDKKMTSSKDEQETSILSPTSSTSVTSHSFLSSPTVNLSPIISPAKFNPVQNLFDKLKQKIDENNSEPSSSKTHKQTNKLREMVDINEIASKVCKMNAKRQLKATPTKKYKNILQRNPSIRRRLAVSVKTPSPVTISDSDSAGKQDDDDIAVLTDESNLSVGETTAENAKSKEIQTDDIIFVNDDSKSITKPLRSKEKISQRNRKGHHPKNVDEESVIVINDEQDPTKTRDEELQRLTETTPKQHHETSQSCEIIVIPDEPNTNQKTKSSIPNEKVANNPLEMCNCGNKQDTSKHDVVIVDEVREIRVSPRLKKVEMMNQKHNDEENSQSGSQKIQAMADEVIIISEEASVSKPNKDFMVNEPQNCLEKASPNKSNSQEFYDANNEQNQKNGDNVVDRNEKSTTANAVKSSRDTKPVALTNEKPKQKKNRLRSPLLPPVLLTPMLLRSELAPKKTNYAMVRERSKVVKPRERSAARSSNFDMKQAKTVQNQQVSETSLIATGNENSKNTQSQSKPSTRLLRSDLSHPKNPQITSQNSSDNDSTSSDDVILVEEQKEMPKSKQKLFRPDLVQYKNSNKSPGQIMQQSMQKADGVLTTQSNSPQKKILEKPLLEQCGNEVIMEKDITFNNEQTKTVEKHTTRLLRSDLFHRKTYKLSAEKPTEVADTTTSTEESPALKVNKRKGECIVIVKEELRPSEKTSPRLLRSDVAKQQNEQEYSASNKEDYAPPVTNESITKQSPKHLRLSTHALQTQQNLLDILKETDRVNTRSSNLKPKEKSPSKSVQSETQSTQCQYIKQSPTQVSQDEDIIIIKDESKPRDNTSPRSLRSSLIQQKEEEREILLIDDNTEQCNEKISPRLLRSNKIKTESPPGSEQVDLDEIVVISEKTVKKPRGRSNGRLLRSGLSLQKTTENSLTTSAVEQSVVLIHDEPKTKENCSTTSNLWTENVLENEQKGNDEESSIVRSRTKSSEKSSRRSLRSAGAPSQNSELKHNAEEETKGNIKSEIDAEHSPDTPSEKHIEKFCPRVLRSDTVSEKSHQYTHSITNEEDRSDKQISPTRSLRSEHSSQQQIPPSATFHMEEGGKLEQVSTPRSLRLERRKYLSKTQEFPVESIEIIDDEESEKQVSSPKSSQSEDDLQTETQNTPELTENAKDETCISCSKSLTSAIIPRKKLQELPKQHCKSSENILASMKEKSPYRRGRSLLMDLKIKQSTTMLLRSELAQLKNVTPNEPEAKKALNTEGKNISPPPTVQVPVQESVETNERRIPKRKSLIEELKKRKLAKQKELSEHTINQSMISEPVKISEDPSKIQNQNPNCENTVEELNSDMPTEVDRIEQNSLKRGNRSQTTSPNKLVDNINASPLAEVKSGKRLSKQKKLKQTQESKDEQMKDGEGSKTSDKASQGGDALTISPEEVILVSNETILGTERSPSSRRRPKDAKESEAQNTSEKASQHPIPLSPEEGKLKSNQTRSSKRNLSSKRILKEAEDIEENVAPEKASQSSTTIKSSESNLKVNESRSLNDAVTFPPDEVIFVSYETKSVTEISLSSKRRLRVTKENGGKKTPEKSAQDTNAITSSPEDTKLKPNENISRKQRNLSAKRKLKGTKDSEESVTPEEDSQNSNIVLLSPEDAKLKTDEGRPCSNALTVEPPEEVIFVPNESRLVTKRSLSSKRRSKSTKESEEKNATEKASQDSNQIILTPEKDKLKAGENISCKQRNVPSKRKVKDSQENMAVDNISQNTNLASSFPEDTKLKANENKSRRQRSLSSKRKVKETKDSEENMSLENISQTSNIAVLSPEDTKLEANKNRSRRQRSLSSKRKLNDSEENITVEEASREVATLSKVTTLSSKKTKPSSSKTETLRQRSLSTRRKLKETKDSKENKTPESLLQNTVSILDFQDSILQNSEGLALTKQTTTKRKGKGRSSEKVVTEVQETNKTPKRPPQNNASASSVEEVKLQIKESMSPKQRNLPPRKDSKVKFNCPENKCVETLLQDNISVVSFSEKATGIENKSKSSKRRSTFKGTLKVTKESKSKTIKKILEETAESLSLPEINESMSPRQRNLSSKRKLKASAESKLLKTLPQSKNVVTSVSSCEEVETETEETVSVKQKNPKRKSKAKATKETKVCETSHQLNTSTSSIEGTSNDLLLIQTKLPIKRRLKQLKVNEALVKATQENNTSTSLLEVIKLEPSNDDVPSKEKKKRLSGKRKLKVTKDGKLPRGEIVPDNNMVTSSPEEVKSEINESMPHKPKRKRKLEASNNNEEHKTPEKLPRTENVPEKTSTDNCRSKADITIFDFDESEPEVVPLRLKNTPRKDRINKPTLEEPEDSTVSVSDVTLNAKKQKSRPKKTSTDASITKAQAKAKLLPVFGKKSLQTNNQSVLEKSLNEGTNSKIRSSLTDQIGNSIPLGESLSSPTQGVINKRNTVSEGVAVPTRTSTSPLKQATITDMFNRVRVKKETAAAADSVFGPPRKDTPPAKSTTESTANIITDMRPPKVERKTQPPKVEESEYYDDDSDCDSRMEWIPEEYAEYKFKYSAKKMMTYKPIHKCKICLLILPTYYKLCKHKEEHTKRENPYDCTQCDQSFSAIEDLTAHLRIHKGKHPYTCKKCDEGFWSKKALDAHTPIHVLRKIKQPNKRFRCDVCAKEFSKVCDMERHTRVHTGEKPCICNICNKGFQQTHNLSKHLLTHLHVKPYHCEICNKQFGRNDVLNRHLLTHSVDKPLKCTYCPKSFIRQAQLTNHLKKYHSGIKNIEAKEESEAIEAN